MNEELAKVLDINRQLSSILDITKRKLEIAIEGLKAINNSVETNIAEKTLEEINNIKSE